MINLIFDAVVQVQLLPQPEMIAQPPIDVEVEAPAPIELMIGRDENDAMALGNM